ncbi:MAG TPA: hypothetical protein VGC22_00395 [Chitinophaga sp.]
MQDHQRKQIEKQMQFAKGVFTDFATAESDVDRFLKLLYHKGLTTPAEYKMIQALVDTLEIQARLFQNIAHSLHSAAVAIIQQKEVEA